MSSPPEFLSSFLGETSGFDIENSINTSIYSKSRSWICVCTRVHTHIHIHMHNQQ